MNSSIMRRAEGARKLGFAVMLAGFLPVLFFVAQSVLVNAATRRVPEMLSQLHAGLVIAMAGFAVMMLGATIARRQLPVLAAAARQREDGLRRAHQYYDGERIEPYIGPGLPGSLDGPQEGAECAGKNSRMSA